MSHASRPSLDEIAVVLAHLADRVAAERSRTLDPFVRRSVARAVTELKRHIPGLYAPPDPDAAAALATASADALRRGRPRAALARALRGLSFAPHHPGLHHLAGSAFLQLGALEEAVRLLQHALWIHPGCRAARQELESMAALPGGAGAEGVPDTDQHMVSGFEMLDEDRQGRLWPDEALEGGEPFDGEFPDDETEDRAA